MAAPTSTLSLSLKRIIRSDRNTMEMAPPPPSFSLHPIQRNPDFKSRLPKGSWGSTSAITDPKYLLTGHHICVSVSNFDSFIRSLKVRNCKRTSHLQSFSTSKGSSSSTFG